MISAALLIVAFVLFIAAALNIASRIGLVPLGLALWVLSILINQGQVLLK